MSGGLVNNGESLFSVLTVDCQCYGPLETEACICPHDEKCLRAYQHGQSLPALTPQQREWCLVEIGSIEGWDRRDHEKDTDSELAGSVLSAWVDYCRDKGLM